MPQGNNDLISRIGQLLANDPICGGRVAGGTVEAIAGLMTEDRKTLGEVLGWLRDDTPAQIRRAVVYASLSKPLSDGE